ncbi:MAG TPA: prolipoprotein diacylglyceryl transferase [Anaerolineales bacterium]|nr:prolipoprotein diacylglyceryl transferase [Anaerolineales bacterium]
MPEGFNLGPLFVRYYGIILMLGAVAGTFLAQRESKKRGYESDVVWDIFIYLLIGGIVGARIWHILTPSPSTGVTTSWYLSHPLDALAVWKGGLGIPGAIIGGLIALYIYSVRTGINFAEWTDIAAPGLALGQAIGRWGNFINQELYGAPTNLPWRIFIDPEHRLTDYMDVEYYHPLFLYESIWNLMNMFLLLWISKRYADSLKNGDVFLVYLIIYPIGRFLLDFLRLDASMVGGININQTIMVFVTIFSSLALNLRHRKVESA